jgi:glycerate kinase
MRIVMAPNAFRGGPSASWVATALASGLRDLSFVEHVESLPLSDGGDGAVEAAELLLGGRRVTVPVSDPVGEAREATYLLTGDGTAVIESAQASGLAGLAGRRLRPLHASTAGTGELILHALSNGARRLLVTAGGTASVDMGAGALAALGARFLDAHGNELAATPAALTALDRVEIGQVRRRLQRIPVKVLSDVSTPLASNIAQFGPQKGVGPDEAPVLERALRALCDGLGDRVGALLHTPLLGAGGGLAAGLHRALGAEVMSGSEYFIQTSGLPRFVDDADLVVTAEGRFDESSLAGKLPFAVARLAAGSGTPALIVTGESTVPDERLPAGTRVVSLGTPPPRPGEATTAERAHLLAEALISALCTERRHHAVRA